MLTEIKDADKVPFLDSPVSATGLFGPAVEGYTEHFTVAQKLSQAMQHFLPKPDLRRPPQHAKTARLSTRDSCPGLCRTQRPRRRSDPRDRKKEGPSPMVALLGPIRYSDLNKVVLTEMSLVHHSIVNVRILQG